MKSTILRELKPLPSQKVFFTCIEYGMPYHICDSSIQYSINSMDEVMLVCGIANPKPLKEYLHNTVHTYYQKDYGDHHIFSIDDLKDIKERFNEISTKRKIILTTEKDAVRLTKFSTELEQLPLYVLPVKHRFLFDDTEQFNQTIIEFVSNFTFNPNES